MSIISNKAEKTKGYLYWVTFIYINRKRCKRTLTVYSLCVRKENKKTIYKLYRQIFRYRYIHTLHKNLFEMDHRPKCKMQIYEIPRT